MSSDSIERPGVGTGMIVHKYLPGGDPEGVGLEYILLGIRRKEYGYGFLSLPGGHVEKYELASEAARRETEEETGLTLGKVHLVGFTEDISREQGKHYITIYFIGEWIGGDPVNTELTKSSDWLWVPVTDLPKLQDKIWYPCVEKFRHMGWL